MSYVEKFLLNSDGSRINRKKFGPMTPSGFEYFGTETRDRELATYMSDPGAPVKLIAKFRGDWLDDLDVAISLAEKTEYTPRKFHPDFLYVTDINAYPGRMPRLQKMSSLLGFFTTGVGNSVQMQRPGCLIPKHRDPPEIFKNQDGTRNIRVLITLAPGEHGQLLGYGNQIITMWEAGDVFFADYANTWHFTANAGYHTRPILQILGQVSDQFWQIINSDTPPVIQI